MSPGGKTIRSWQPLKVIAFLHAYRNCGCLIVGPKAGDPFLEDTRAAMIRHNVSHETFGVDTAKKLYPGLSYPSNYEFLLDKSGGLLMADKMLSAFQVKKLGKCSQRPS